MKTFFAPQTALDIGPVSSSAVPTAPQWIGHGTAANTATPNPITTLGLPTGRLPGDLLLLLVQNDNASSLGGDNPSDTAYAGWTLVGRQPTTSSGANSARITAYYAWSQDISSAPTIADTGDHQSAVICGYRGVNPDNPFNAIAAGLNNTAATAVSMNVGVTTTVDLCRVLYLLTNNSDAVGTDWFAGTVTNANLTDLHYTHADRFNQKWNVGTGGGLCVIDGIKTVAGATGTTSGTQNSTNAYRWLTVALEPIP